MLATERKWDSSNAKINSWRACISVTQCPTPAVREADARGTARDCQWVQTLILPLCPTPSLGEAGVRKLMVNRRDPGRISTVHPALLAWGQDELSKCQSGEGESWDVQKRECWNSAPPLQCSAISETFLDVSSLLVIPLWKLGWRGEEDEVLRIVSLRLGCGLTGCSLESQDWLKKPFETLPLFLLHVS